MQLSLKGVTVYYGQALAIEDITMEVPQGAVVSVIGANGAGKSTIMNAICGVVPITGGEILFEGKKINGMRASDIVKFG
jgi:branched-chain amino acid transport system ATP-binding protein